MDYCYTIASLKRFPRVSAVALGLLALIAALAVHQSSAVTTQELIEKLKQLAEKAEELDSEFKQLAKKAEELDSELEQQQKAEELHSEFKQLAKKAEELDSELGKLILLQLGEFEQQLLGIRIRFAKTEAESLADLVKDPKFIKTEYLKRNRQLIQIKTEYLKNNLTAALTAAITAAKHGEKPSMKVEELPPKPTAGTSGTPGDIQTKETSMEVEELPPKPTAETKEQAKNAFDALIRKIDACKSIAEFSQLAQAFKEKLDTRGALSVVNTHMEGILEQIPEQAKKKLEPPFADIAKDIITNLSNLSTNLKMEEKIKFVANNNPSFVKYEGIILNVLGATLDAFLLLNETKVQFIGGLQTTLDVNQATLLLLKVKAEFKGLISELRITLDDLAQNDLEAMIEFVHNNRAFKISQRQQLYRFIENNL